MIRRWVLERTILLGNVEFINPGKFWGMPAPVIHGLEIERILKSVNQISSEELVKRINQYNFPLYYC
jgi:pantothenate kinase